MATKIKLRNIICLFYIISFIYGCSPNQRSSTPKGVLNPWPDDYTSISSMENYLKWGTYNVHDPTFKKFGEYYYMYSTDAIFAENRNEAKAKNVPIGNIQIRRSKDLINWEFVGWAFSEIPKEAIDWVHENNNGKGATNIWAPYVIKYKNTYRLYYSISAFGKKTSYIGLAESSTPIGPWELKGCVVKTNKDTPMNAIDPSVIENPNSGRLWMHYGSYFGGLYCVELNPETGLTITEGDLGHLVARRANYKKDNLEAPEIIYNEKLNKYFLFTSYDPLMTTYNVRVARSDNPEGPFYDFFGKDLKDTTNNFPILVAPYKFNNHKGWAGTAHCGITKTDDGRYFMAHQGRLSPQNHLMVLHVRELFFTPDGWPVASPERYAGDIKKNISKKEIPGNWELIHITEPQHERELEAGQILWGEGELHDNEWNASFTLHLSKDGSTSKNGTWSYSKDNNTLSLSFDNKFIDNLQLFWGHDWENETGTLIFTGLDQNGRSLWGKQIDQQLSPLRKVSAGKCD